MKSKSVKIDKKTSKKILGFLEGVSNKKKRYDHAISFNVSLNSNNEEPTSKEILDKLQKALSELDETNILDTVEIFDTLDRENGNE